MISLKDMIERRDELLNIQTNNPSAWYSELQVELSELYSNIALRTKYLERYINHQPFVADLVHDKLQEFIGEENTALTRARMKDAVSSLIRNLLATRQIFGKTDADDLEFFFSDNLKVN